MVEPEHTAAESAPMDRSEHVAQLDHALEEWVTRAVPAWSPERRHALMARIGWLGRTLPTLEETGDAIGLTRERARQLQVNLVIRLRRTRPTDEDAFRRATQLIAENRFEPRQPLGYVLSNDGLLVEPLPDIGLKLLFSLLGAQTMVEEYQHNWLRRSAGQRQALRVARALARSVGVASVSWVREGVDGSIDVPALRHEISAAPWVRMLDEEWFRDPTTRPGFNRLVNLTTKILAACGALELHELRDGLDRQVRLGRMPYLPPLQALRLFYADHPDFAISPLDVVSSLKQLDPDRVLDSTERTLYRILHSAPLGFLDRAELQRLATAAGINQNTFSVYTSYSPILDNPVQDRWVLRGSDVSPAAFEARRRQRKHRHALVEWTEQGTLRMERETPDYWNMIVSVPRALRPYVAGRTFEAVDDGGTRVGRVRWDENGTSWGYSGFLQASGARDGDILIADFDLLNASVLLQLRVQNHGAVDAAN